MGVLQQCDKTIAKSHDRKRHGAYRAFVVGFYARTDGEEWKFARCVALVPDDENDAG